MKPLHVARSNPWAGLLSAFVLCLVSPLWAKCPTYSVKIRGKVECYFKPEDKVLVTLIFSSRQLEASGEETAVDIHDATFSGRVAFHTYSSSSLLGGDKCHRRPESVLVRLIAADGIEKDRASLKIASDFNYDEEQGEYSLKSDVILHGWCESQCDGATDWHKLDAGAFSIFAPPAWEFHQLIGVDSYVGEFVGDGIMLKFDFGRYSRSFKAKEPVYMIARRSIGGLPATTISPRTPGHGVTGIYFRKIIGRNALCLWGQDLTSAQQELALKIFETIRFAHGQLPSFIPPPAKSSQ